MTQPGSVVHSQLEELYASARAARGRAKQTVRRAQASQPAFRAAVRRHHQARVRGEGLKEQWLTGQYDRTRYSAYTRLHARMASMPVIEQAKGIIMAQFGWAADEAFDALRRASQQRNLRIRDLAAEIVSATARAAEVPAVKTDAGAWDGEFLVLAARRSRQTTAG